MERMKGRKEHQVPLNDQALTVLKRMDAQRVNEVIFSGQQPGRALSNMACSRCFAVWVEQILSSTGFSQRFGIGLLTKPISRGKLPKLLSSILSRIKLRLHIGEPTFLKNVAT
jgi:integrase